MSKPTQGVVLSNPRFDHNVGAALRATACFDYSTLAWTGTRVDPEEIKAQGRRLPREERMKAYDSVTQIHARDNRPFDHFSTDVIPVCIELSHDAEQLQDFEHPENAVYVFGPEDGSVPRGIRVMCHRFVVIPTLHCTNLAAAVYITLYDRRAKRIREGLDSRFSTADMLREQRGPILSSTS